MRNPDSLALFRAYVPGLKRCASGVEWLGRCPYLDCSDKKAPKFYVNTGSGQYHCKRCGAKGNAVTFAKHFGDDPRPFYDTPGNEPTSSLSLIDPGKVDSFHKALLGNRALWPLPWREEIIRRLEVGWDTNEEKLLFPIFDETRLIENIVRHKGRQLRGARVSLYPAHLLNSYAAPYLVICEGMKDCVSLLSVEIQAVTSTGGASSIPNDISVLRRFERIFLCLDNDGSGDRGTDGWINRIQSEFSKVKVRVCNLSSYVDEAGDVSDYLSLAGKNRNTFISEVLERARVGRPFSDVPDFVRQIILSDKFTSLDPRDRFIYSTLVFRVSRYRFRTAEINGLRVLLQPGEFVTSYEKLAEICPPYSTKMMRTSLRRLQDARFIRRRDLRERRGQVIALIGWCDGHTDRHTESVKIGTPNFPVFSLEALPGRLQDGHADLAGLGSDVGQVNSFNSGEEEIQLGENSWEESNGGIENGMEKVWTQPRSKLICCGDCHHIIRDPANHKQGWARCQVGMPASWPMTLHLCAKFEPAPQQETWEL